MDMRPGLRLWSWLARRARQRVGARVVLAWDRRAGVALITALSMPVLLMSVAMGVEVSHWSAQQLDLQRTADLAALAGANAYGSALAQGDTAAQAVTVAAAGAADVAELNGAAGGSRSWSPAAKTLTDNQITVLITSGVRNPADPAVQVTVHRVVPLLFARIATATRSVGLGARAMAEVSASQDSPQPCVLTLNGSANGVVTLPGVTASGNTDASMSGCSLVSDGNVSMSGNLMLDVSAIYAAGTISMSGNVSGTGAASSAHHAGSPQILDPYASNSALQDAIAKANCSPTQGPTVSGNTYNLYPGVCYGSISVGGNSSVVFNGTGLYTVNGSISISGNTSVGGTTISGSGITIVSTGPLSISGNFNSGSILLTAPTAGTVQAGAVAGVLFATNSTGANTVTGNSAIPFSGLLYMPNGSLSISGNATDGSNGCAEIIAGTLTLSGNMDLATNCSDYGLISFGSLPNTTSIGLVE